MIRPCLPCAAAAFAAYLGSHPLAVANIDENLEQLGRRYTRGSRHQVERADGITEAWFARDNLAVRVLMIGGEASDETFFNATEAEIAAIRATYGDVWQKPAPGMNKWVSKDGLEAFQTLVHGGATPTFDFNVSDGRARFTTKLAESRIEFKERQGVWKPTHPRYLALQKDIVNFEAKLQQSLEAASARKRSKRTVPR